MTGGIIPLTEAEVLDAMQMLDTSKVRAWGRAFAQRLTVPVNAAASRAIRAWVSGVPVRRCAVGPMWTNTCLAAAASAPGPPPAGAESAGESVRRQLCVFLTPISGQQATTQLRALRGSDIHAPSLKAQEGAAERSEELAALKELLIWKLAQLQNEPPVEEQVCHEHRPAIASSSQLPARTVSARCAAVAASLDRNLACGGRSCLRRGRGAS